MKEILKIDSSVRPTEHKTIQDQSDSLKNLLGICPKPVSEMPGKSIPVSEIFANKNLSMASNNNKIELPRPPPQWTRPDNSESSTRTNNENGNSSATFFPNNQKWDSQKRFRTHQHIQQQNQFMHSLNQPKSPINVSASVNSFVPLQAARKTTKCNNSVKIEKPQPIKNLPDVIHNKPEPVANAQIQVRADPPQQIPVQEMSPANPIKPAVVKKSRLALKFPVDS